MANVLIVDDDSAVRAVLARLIGRHGHVIHEAADGIEGAQAVRSLKPDLVVTDMEMPAGSGFQVLEAGSAAKVPVVILTAHATVELAVDAMRRGAANFLAKPFNAESVGLMLQEALGGMTNGGGRVTRPSPAQREAEESRTPIVGEDEEFRAVLANVERVAGTDATILITGESGTGKEVVARAIHNASRRRDKQFVAVNCGAVPEALLESELFGHVRGAFTGATQARRGRFQVAEGGTLFLDEIGDMPLVLQVRLLRVIQERQFEVLGDSRPQAANVRFIAATHRDLEQMVAEGKFREDLYYRLNVVPLHLPPLRERARDIPLLIAHFIKEANATHGCHVTGISDEALAALSAHPFPGNIRELSNLIERMTVLRGEGPIELRDVPTKVRDPGRGAAAKGNAIGDVRIPEGGIDLSTEMSRVEGLLMEKALERARGNKTQAAQLLRINRTTFVEKMKRQSGDD